MTSEALPARPVTRPSIVALVLAWAPAALYMLLIWTLSSFSVIDFPTESFPLRDKGVHACEFLVLGFLVTHAWLRTAPGRPLLRVALVSWSFAVMWGLLDEIHQAYVPGRSSDIADLVADGVGAAVGVTLRVAWFRFWQWRTRAAREA